MARSENKRTNNGSGTGPKKTFSYKRTKLFNSRMIRTEVQDPAFTNPTAENTRDSNVVNRDNVPNKLDVSKFLASREYEIKEFELSQLRSRHSSATRVFQQLPRHMRRRTASHNVRRVPKRLRSKALREMGLNLINNENGNKETKGVDSNGRPIKSKHHRGRELYNLRRKAKLLKYAGKHKLTGHLLSNEIVSAKSVKLREKLQSIKKAYEQIEKEREQLEEERLKSIESSNDSNDLSIIERRHQREISKVLNNQVGSFDNTIINGIPTSNRAYAVKYATRQRKYKWLPTHKWHAKRAKIIKRWGWSLVSEPTLKCYRKTSRNSRSKGLIAFDTSYMSHLILNCYYSEGSPTEDQKYIQELITDLTDGEATKPLYFKKYRVCETFLFIDGERLGKASIFWHNDHIAQQLRCVIEVHPVYFKTVSDYLLGKIKNEGLESKITLHDCRFSLGSIQLTGPESISALLSILHKSKNVDPNYDLLKMISKVNNNSSTVPQGTLLSFLVNDPRLIGKPSLAQTKLDQTNNPDAVMDALIAINNGEGVEKSSLNSLLTIDGRLQSYRNEPTLKELGKRRKPELSGKPIPKTIRDPNIPVAVIFGGVDEGRCQIKLICPWFWVSPFWMVLNKVHRVSIGGLKQLHQLSFERGELDPLQDAPFTRVGFLESELKKIEAERDWKKKPKGKRVQYDKIKISNTEIGELGNPFCCDWRYLQRLRYGCLLRRKFLRENKAREEKRPSLFNEKSQRVIRSRNDILDFIKDREKADEELKALGELDDKLPVILASGDRCLGFNNNISKIELNLPLSPKYLPPVSVVPIKFSCMKEGRAEENARIYLEGDSVNDCDPEVPTFVHLAGFVTSAAFNLSLGKATGVGFVDRFVFTNGRYRSLIIRNVGSNKPIVIKYDVIKDRSLIRGSTKIL